MSHTPVLCERAVDLLAAGRPLSGRLMVDCTLGMGGHSEALLERGARVLALDRDADSLALAATRLERFAREGRFQAHHADYRRLLEILAREVHGPVDGVLADLGISSQQLAAPERGFSFSHDGPLDMRMDRSSSATPTAAQLVATLDERELRQLLREFGEEPASSRIAAAIVRARALAPILTTLALARVVEAASPRRWNSGRSPIHPATLTFQALRIAVNREVDGLEQFVSDAALAVPRRGRLVFIAFHSLEDRPIKTALRRLEKGCLCPPELPFCACGIKPQLRLLGRKAAVPTDDEIAANPRARSARMRAAEKLTDELSPLLARTVA